MRTKDTPRATDGGGDAAVGMARADDVADTRVPVAVAVVEYDAGLAEKEAVAVAVGGADCDRLTLALRLSDADRLRGELVRDGDTDRESNVALLMLGDADADGTTPLRVTLRLAERLTDVLAP